MAVLTVFFSVERFTGKETGRDRPAGVQGPTSTGKHQHHQSPNPMNPNHAHHLIRPLTATQRAAVYGKQAMHVAPWAQGVHYATSKGTRCL